MPRASRPPVAKGMWGLQPPTMGVHRVWYSPILIPRVLHAILPWLYQLYLYAYRPVGYGSLVCDRLLAMLRTSNRARGPDGTLTLGSLCQYRVLGLGGGHIGLYDLREGVST